MTANEIPRSHNRYRCAVPGNRDSALSAYSAFCGPNFSSSVSIIFFGGGGVGATRRASKMDSS